MATPTIRSLADTMRQPTIAGIATTLFCLLCGIALCLNIYSTVSTHKDIADCKGSEACFSRVILDTIADKDLDDGFRLLGSIYADTPSFRPECSRFTLRLTEDIYLRYPDYTQLHLTPEIVSCNYGFLQQYPASILLATKDMRAAQRFCAFVARSVGKTVPGAEAECYRGIGRGLPFADPASQGDPVRMTEFAIRACKDLTSDASNYGTCLSGLFNIIGRTEAAKQSGLSIETVDPMRLCKIQTDPEARDHCFGNFKATVISMVNTDDTASAEQDILRLYRDKDITAVSGAMWTLGYEWGRAKLVSGEPFAPAIAACTALSPAYMHLCIQGISVGIAKHGVPGRQHILMTAFCKAARTSIATLVPDDCPSQQAVGYIRGFYSPDAYNSAYLYMRSELGSVVALPDVSYGY